MFEVETAISSPYSLHATRGKGKSELLCLFLFLFEVFQVYDENGSRYGSLQVIFMFEYIEVNLAGLEWSTTEKGIC